MSHDPSVITTVNREAVLNSQPGLGQFITDNFLGPIHLRLAIAFTTADAAVLYTVPTGVKIEVDKVYWQIATSFTGGSSSAIGVSSANAAYNTKGDLLGGASGDVAAVVISTGSPYKGTVGAKMAKAVAGTTAVVVLVAGDTIRFDQVTSTFTAGAGFVHLTGTLLVD
jgi:hypothetical protein